MAWARRKRFKTVTAEKRESLEERERLHEGWVESEKSLQEGFTYKSKYALGGFIKVSIKGPEIHQKQRKRKEGQKSLFLTIKHYIGTIKLTGNISKGIYYKDYIITDITHKTVSYRYSKMTGNTRVRTRRQKRAKNRYF